MAWAELRLALVGSLRLARGDRGGLDCFDRSLEGFWRSFRAAIIAYPLYLILLTMRVSVADGPKPNLGAIEKKRSPGGLCDAGEDFH